MEAMGVISKVDQPTPWCAGMIVVSKQSRNVWTSNHLMRVSSEMFSPSQSRRDTSPIIRCKDLHKGGCQQRILSNSHQGVLPPTHHDNVLINSHLDFKCPRVLSIVNSSYLEGFEWSYLPNGQYSSLRKGPMGARYKTTTSPQEN